MVHSFRAGAVVDPPELVSAAVLMATSGPSRQGPRLLPQAGRSALAPNRLRAARGVTTRESCVCWRAFSPKDANRRPSAGGGWIEMFTMCRPGRRPGLQDPQLEIRLPGGNRLHGLPSIVNYDSDHRQQLPTTDRGGLPAYLGAAGSETQSPTGRFTLDIPRHRTPRIHRKQPQVVNGRGPLKVLGRPA